MSSRASLTWRDGADPLGLFWRAESACRRAPAGGDFSRQHGWPGQLHVCATATRRCPRELSRRDARLQFHGLLPSPEDCLRWAAQHCDVLVNPRPRQPRQRNNFPSKVFEYALCGRTILTSRLAGVEAVLGAEASYFDPRDFARNSRGVVSAFPNPRGELLRRGIALRERIVTRYSLGQTGGDDGRIYRRLS